ncbi:conserved exported hypothetical protein [Hyphomicrobiales bacterium]|nr:conserved exported hypothetical protein [Hyphomicrobiales bacterium]CAH1694300.1 conserved exported hypothetical protein [Hyphomicrobiales bacterium]
MLLIRAIPSFLLLGFPALAQDLRPPRPLYSIECGAQFARSASHSSLVKRYGAKNVTFEDVNRPEGEVVKASVLFAKDPDRRLEIEWYDEKKRRMPSTITVFGETNRWIGPLGIKNGMTIQEIEQRAGKPFKINGFGFDVAGAGHFEDTKLEKLPGGCSFNAHFDIEGGLPPDHLERFVGDVAISSDDPDLLTLKPKLWIYTLTYSSPMTD